VSVCTVKSNFFVIVSNRLKIIKAINLYTWEVFSSTRGTSDVA